LTKKLNQFWILKFNSNRLRDYGYNINIELDDARKNNELVSIGQSEVIRSLFRITRREFNQYELEGLIKQKRKIIKRKNKQENSIKLLEIQNKINKILFVEEIISVKFANKSHYKKIMKDGLFINGNRYVRLLASAGNIRLNTVVFCREDIRDRLCGLLENDRDESLELIPAKFNTYFALVNSSTIRVTFPKICVVKDCFISIKKEVDYIIEDDGSGKVIQEKKLVDIELNSFDGQGFVSPNFAEIWSKDLGLDYIPASFIVRSPFLKGMVCVFPFHRFAAEVAEKDFIVDIYGDIININEIDVIISESQLKLWNGYKNTADYLTKCEKNKLGFGISRVSPKEDNSYVTSNYQFLQILDLDDSMVDSICKPTIDWFNDLSGKNYQKMLLYFTGKMADTEAFNVDVFGSLDNITKALMLNSSISKDKYVRTRFLRSLNKKIRDSYLGKLIFQGNYSFLIADPYAQAEHIFGLKVSGLLVDGQHYSSFWNKRDIKNVAACRPPLTFQSELNILNFEPTRKQEDWFSYIDSGIIIPAGGIGIDTVLFADADHDGDIIATFNSEEFIHGKKDGLPILYDKNSASKRKINSLNDKILSKTDVGGFNCKVGYITNVASSLYCFIDNFIEGSKEYNEILTRIKRCRKFQGDSIDSGKGIKTEPFPEKFVKFQSNPNNNAQVSFENSIIIEKRPYYFRYLYSDYARRYKNHFDNYNIHSIIKFGVSLSSLLEKDVFELTEEQFEFIENYYRYSFFMFYPSTMNRVCNKMEVGIKELRVDYKNGNFDYSILMADGFVANIGDIDRMRDLYKQYKKYKSEMHRLNDNKNSAYEGIEHFISYIRDSAYRIISTNIGELASLAVNVCYEKNPNASSEFAWKCFGDGIIQNIYDNKEDKIITVPQRHENGDIKYLWRKYNFVDKTIGEEELF